MFVVLATTFEADLCTSDGFREAMLNVAETYWSATGHVYCTLHFEAKTNQHAKTAF